MTSSAQLRAGRALLGLSVADVARRAGVPVEAVERLEGAPGDDPAARDLHVSLRRALEQAGIVFVEAGAQSDRGGPGVRLRLKPDEGLRPDQLTTENDD